MTKRERTLLTLLAVLVLFAGSLIGWVLFDSAARGRLQAIRSLEVQKDGLIQRLVLSPEDRQALEDFVVGHEDALMSAELVEESIASPAATESNESRIGVELSDTLNSLLPSNGLEIQNFRVSSSDATIQFEVRGSIVNILATIRASEARGIRYETAQISRLRDNLFSWRGTVLGQ